MCRIGAPYSAPPPRPIECHHGARSVALPPRHGAAPRHPVIGN